MRVMRRAALAAAACAFAAFAHATSPPPIVDAYPGVASGYLVRIDGVDRWAAQPAARLRPASLTKIVAALLVIEAVGDDATITVSSRAASASGARVGLKTGMQFAAGDLLKAMLLRSANDACLALAEHVAGSEREFVRRMNARAAALKLADTRFVNACGFEAPGHYASPRDLAALAEAALANPRFSAIVGLERAEIRARDGRVFRFDNSNVLVGRVDGARGVKTGWTQAAGRCLVAYAERGGARVLVVLLGAPDRWWDAVAMIENAFDDALARKAAAASVPAR